MSIRSRCMVRTREYRDRVLRLTAVALRHIAMPTDPLSEGLLVTVSAPGPTSKQKTLQLYNPDLIVELKYTGTISFKWGFKWEECVIVPSVRVPQADC